MSAGDRFLIGFGELDPGSASWSMGVVSTEEGGIRISIAAEIEARTAVAAVDLDHDQAMRLTDALTRWRGWKS